MLDLKAGKKLNKDFFQMNIKRVDYYIYPDPMLAYYAWYLSLM